jgi:prepilin-type N-terminal cleavage/methylation domain-containing protein
MDMNKKRHAFTLIELLVVVAIITVLVGMLLPSLAGVRETSRQVKCQAQLRSIGQAVRGYIDEYGGFYPPIALIPSLPGETRPAMHDILGPYVGNQQEIFHCPSDRIMQEQDSTNLPPAGVETYFAWQGSSYQPRDWLSFDLRSAGWLLTKEGREEGYGAMGEIISLVFGGVAHIPIIHEYEPFHKPFEGSRMTLFADFHADFTDGGL